MRPRPVVLMATAVLIAGLVAVGVWLVGLHADCSNRWRDSGLRAHYRDGACLVEAGGRWYPSHVIRVWVREPG